MDAHETEPLTPEEEAELQKEIDLAIEPYKAVAPPALLKQMRDKLEEGMRAHPVPRSLLRRFAPRPGVDVSGEVTRGGGQEKDKAGGGEEGA
jgi:hypothetical protein